MCPTHVFQPEDGIRDIGVTGVQTCALLISFDITLHYPNSMRAVLRSSILAAAQRPRFVLLGTQGGFVKQTFDPQEMNLRRGYIPEDKPWGCEPEENWGVLTIPKEDRFEQRRIPSATCDYR